MRFQGSTTLEEANAFLPGFIERYNARFAKAPQDPNSAWVPLPADLDASYYFAIRATRKVRADHCIRFSGQILQLLPDPKDPSLVHQSVTVHVVPEGDIHLYDGKRPIAYRPFAAPAAVPPRPQGEALPLPKPVQRTSTARQRAWLFGQG